MSYQSQNEPIAIIGASCRLPGDSTTPAKLWQLLREPKDVASNIPEQRFKLDKFYHPQAAHHGTSNVQQSYFLSEDVRYFDTNFFGIPPGEAEAMDPQHRILLETVYEAVEAGGYTLDNLHGSNTAVYVGLMCSDYYVLQAQDLNFIPTYNATGIANSNASSRISYFFDWHGPSMTIDTACSSSLVAVHQAVQALRSGVSDVAVAAGTNLLLCPLPYVSESNLSMLSPTGRSRMWDIDADGYARGDGVACVLLKKLSAAIRDGDVIEGVIRETGVNQDGKTKGITMPSATAQAKLIKETYARAGLDCTNHDQRCQYFEAHGTGTQAGDPQEAEALHTAFFPGPIPKDPNDILYVGSCKTVIGHTEGTAGIAGLLKACWALKHATLPPNLLFNRLNPKLEPFTNNLRILSEAQPWPKLAPGVPRRASVNSFGFGGTNAHAILEHYEAPASTVSVSEASTPLTPFLFSASSEQSLRLMLGAYQELFSSRSDVKITDLSYTLACHRSTLKHRVAFSARDMHALSLELQNYLDSSHENTQAREAAKSLGRPARILGIFTGQGAQWASMGAKLIDDFEFAAKVIEELDDSLATLPLEDRPSWTIKSELMADTDKSRLSEAEFSQPLCTAIQILLAKLLAAAGVTFSAVVGHSSGEIGAAYAAGFISAADAIRIAYYRGKFARLAAGETGEKGSMMAVGTSFEDATEFCALEDFESRICVAASNSSNSVTISGDVDAIDEAKSVFDEEKKFARLLKVDTAYHSHHMKPCSVPYLEALKRCNIKVLQPTSGVTKWYSSVENGKLMDPVETLQGQYWVDNMCQTVLFSQAISQACSGSDPFDFAYEVGPHPALKGPALDVIGEKLGKKIPYAGSLSRFADDVLSFSRSLGAMWSEFGAASIDVKQLQETVHSWAGGVSRITNLPPYAWNHDRLLWSESRATKAFRIGEGSFHELLGTRTPDGTAEEWHWRNVLKTKEISWLAGHALQGQIVFPATGYIALAMEAALQIAHNDNVKSIELHDLKIIKAIAVNENTGTELLVSMTNVWRDEVNSTISADYAVFSTLSRDTLNMGLNTSGHVCIQLGELSDDFLASRASEDHGLAEVDIDRFYTAMRNDLGYMYEGPFKALSSLSRKLGRSAGTLQRPAHDAYGNPLIFHPGLLDSALQGMFAAFSAPGDGRLWSMHAPTSLKRFTILPHLCGSNMPESVAFDCVVTDARRGSISGDVDVFTLSGEKMIEVDGLSFSPFSAATPGNDRHLFSEEIWGCATQSGDRVVGARRPEASEVEKALDAERVAFFYLRFLDQTIPKEERMQLDLPPHQRALFNNIDRLTKQVSEGTHPWATEDWLSDTRSQMEAIVAKYDATDADFQLSQAVGENMPAVIRKETTILEHMTKDNKLENFYKMGVAFDDLNNWVSTTIRQLAFRYPRMKMLEIGAGTGGASRKTLEELKGSFASYTYTDISAGFFEKAQENFSEHAAKMIFKTLNIENVPSSQGFEEGTYDLVLAANVLHATPDLEQTLRNTRRLLRPGGFLVLMEIVNNDVMRYGFVMGGLPGWWIGADDGRPFQPTIDLSRWDKVLKASGFSGVDTSTPLHNPIQMPGSVFVSQALSDDFRLIRDPLSTSKAVLPLRNVLIVGGSAPKVKDLVGKLLKHLHGRCDNILLASTLDDLSSDFLPRGCATIVLSDCEAPVLENVSEKRWRSLRDLLAASTSILWVTKDYRLENPYAAMSIGLLRSLYYELPSTQIQSLDIQDLDNIDDAFICETFLRLAITRHWRETGSSKNFLWTDEPELILENGELKIMRVSPHAPSNNRYNSAKRQIIRQAPIDHTRASLEWTSTGYILREQFEQADSVKLGYVTVEVEASLVCSMNLFGHRLFICIGHNKATLAKVLAVSSQNLSIISVPQEWTVPIQGDVEKSITAPYLSFVVAYLSSTQLLASVPEHASILLHEPDPGLASVITKQALSKGISVSITSCDSTVRRRNWLYLHPRATRRTIESTVPRNVNYFFDFSTAGDKSGEIGQRIAATLSDFCQKYNKSFLFAQRGLLNKHARINDIHSLLAKANDFATTTLNGVPDGMPLSIISVTQAVGAGLDIVPSCIVSWNTSSSIPVQVEPIDHRSDLLKPDKTYWLAGLTGDLGRSICEWMISKGAKYIVLTSRNPKVPTQWLDYWKARGATIACYANDITSLDDVKRIHQKITQDLPPIGGVANGALLLRDQVVSSMELATWETVTRPKVLGTANLNAVFNEKDLDWFIMFSSIVATVGNLGQAAYAAGNLYMKTCVADRRRRGLAGSVIDISRVVGVGYVEREANSDGGKLTTEQMNRLVARAGALPLSEPDLHQLFAEGIVASNPKSELNPELISGIYPQTPEQAELAFWKDNPKFSHMIQDLKADTAAEQKVATVVIPVKTKLEKAKTQKEVVTILIDALVAKLRISLCMPVTDSLSVSNPLIDIGVDSLVAVEVRTWFLQELAADLPVLKILGGASIEELIEYIVDGPGLSKNLVPNLE